MRVERREAGGRGRLIAFGIERRVGSREAEGLPKYQGRLDTLEACDVALAVNHTNFVFVRSEVNAASSRHDSPDPLTPH